MAKISTQPTRNYLINGNFDIWQRNTSFSSPAFGVYTADRWSRGHISGTGGTFTISRQAFTLGQTSVPNEPSYFLRHDQTVAGSGQTFSYMAHRIESVKTLAGKTATASIWLKADTTRNVDIAMVQAFGTGGSPSASVSAGVITVALTTSWKKFDLTFNIPSISGKTLGTANNDYLELQIRFPLDTTFTIDLAQAGVYEGVYRGRFQYAGGGSSYNPALELTLCERYYEKSWDLTTPTGTATTTGCIQFIAQGSNSEQRAWPYRTRKRAPGVVGAYSTQTGTPGKAFDVVGGVDVNWLPEGNGDAGTGWQTAQTAGRIIRFHYAVEAEL